MKDSLIALLNKENFDIGLKKSWVGGYISLLYEKEHIISYNKEKKSWELLFGDIISPLKIIQTKNIKEYHKRNFLNHHCTNKDIDKDICYGFVGKLGNKHLKELLKEESELVKLLFNDIKNNKYTLSEIRKEYIIDYKKSKNKMRSWGQKLIEEYVKKENRITGHIFEENSNYIAYDFGNGIIVAESSPKNPTFFIKKKYFEKLRYLRFDELRKCSKKDGFIGQIEHEKDTKKTYSYKNNGSGTIFKRQNRIRWLCNVFDMANIPKIPRQHQYQKDKFIVEYDIGCIKK